MPGLYTFGYAQHRLLSLHAQQRRGLNLACALAAEWEAAPSEPDVPMRVLVVGAGVGGLTFAAGAARLGAEVQVVDHAPIVMGNLRFAYHRYLHPHMLLWPHHDWDKPDADVPLLPWSAGWADQVWAHLAEQFEELRAEMSIGLHVAASGLKVRWLRSGSARFRAAWSRHAVGEPGRGRNGIDMTFHRVVMALGPGAESRKFSSPRYWDQDDRALDEAALKRRVLVSGAGDGGLIDTIRQALFDRACAEPVSQVTLMRLWIEHVVEEAGDLDPNSHQLLDLDAFVRRQEALRRALADNRWLTRQGGVHLVVRGGPLIRHPDPRSSDFHKVFVRLLLEAKRVAFAPDRELPDLEHDTEKGEWRVGRRRYHRVLVRHGGVPPQLALKGAPRTWTDDAWARRSPADGDEVPPLPDPLYAAETFGLPRGAPPRVRGWSHDAGELLAQLSADVRAGDMFAGQADRARIEALPERVTWLHDRLGRPEHAPLKERARVGGNLAETARRLVLDRLRAEADERTLKPSKWFERLQSHGSLSRTRLVLPPSPAGRMALPGPLGAAHYRSCWTFSGLPPEFVDTLTLGADPLGYVGALVSATVHGAGVRLVFEGGRVEEIAPDCPVILDLFAFPADLDGEESARGVRLAFVLDAEQELTARTLGLEQRAAPGRVCRLDASVVALPPAETNLDLAVTSDT